MVGYANEGQREYLADESNEMYEYDLLNVLKSSFIKDIYIDTKPDEAILIREAIDFIKEMGAIPSYCYLGDVGESPTGHKKAQKFEDDYLERCWRRAGSSGSRRLRICRRAIRWRSLSA